MGSSGKLPGSSLLLQQKKEWKTACKKPTPQRHKREQVPIYSRLLSKIMKELKGRSCG